MKLDFFGIEKLNFVEFNITGSSAGCDKLSQESYFLSSEVFNLFAKCFENSDDKFEYYGPTKFNARNIVILQNELASNLIQLREIKSCESFKSLINSIFLGKDYIDGLDKKMTEWSDHWLLYLDKLIDVNKRMLDITDKCIGEEHTLWVIGY